jgi:hypothetical protein
MDMTTNQLVVCQLCDDKFFGKVFLLYADHPLEILHAIICKSCTERLLHTNRAVMDDMFFWQIKLKTQYRALVELFGFKVLKVDTI